MWSQKFNYFLSVIIPAYHYFFMKLVFILVVFLTIFFYRNEQLRRAALKNGKYFIRVLFNDIEVSRTATKWVTVNTFHLIYPLSWTYLSHFFLNKAQDSYTSYFEFFYDEQNLFSLVSLRKLERESLFFTTFWPFIDNLISW